MVMLWVTLVKIVREFVLFEVKGDFRIPIYYYPIEDKWTLSFKQINLRNRGDWLYDCNLLVELRKSLGDVKCGVRLGSKLPDIISMLC
jgi:hypothetical protein